MHIVDHVLILLLLIAQPVYGAYQAGLVRKDAEAGKPLNRVKWYSETIVWEWAFLAVLLIAWTQLARPFADLGFVESGGRGFWIGVAIVVAMIGYLFFTHQRIRKMDDEERAKNIEELGDIKTYLPHTSRELKYFTGVSATAGIVEEIVYRGFVIWYFSQFMSLWPAVIASSVLFGFAHSYQGVKGAVRCGSIGLGFGAFYVLTGSIWLPIVAHFLLDALQGVALRELLEDSDDTEAPFVGQKSG